MTNGSQPAEPKFWKKLGPAGWNQILKENWVQPADPKILEKKLGSVGSTQISGKKIGVEPAQLKFLQKTPPVETLILW